MKILLVVLIPVTLFVLWWHFGGIHLDYLKENGIKKAREVCDDERIVYEGYQRQLFIGGVGGRVWFMCEINEIPVEFYISRRIDNKELQVYNINQVLNFPTEFQINN